MKDLSNFINDSKYVNESFVGTMLAVVGGLVLFNSLKYIGGMGLSNSVNALVKHWESTGVNINKRQRELIETILSFAKGNDKCPKYNKFVNELEKNQLNDGIQYNITDIIKELASIVETEEQKNGLKELIKLQCKQLTATRNLQIGDDKWSKKWNEDNKNDAEELKEIAKSL